ncbi:helicase [Nocardioides marmoriginsengisoli]|uniref:Helicase n=1 Tax=Nocardioides marmoriginsengisoli TaxID=661483 RepID=A0A3N0CAP4_9ACTN|nr:UvrD-helicase domain-containing protein [Nocardioides marmoriginsengisoli]RNL60535.1 helicase [Nocardioides marmoriginsengisoli]
MNDDVAAREIASEQEFVDTVYRQLADSARSAEQLAAEGRARGQLGHEGGLVERDAMLFQAAKRIATLDAAHEGLVFGRLDMRDEIDDEPRYVGRIGLRDGNHDILLIDWRAPASAVFYQATPAEPQGVIRRRILRSVGETVVGVEDDLLDPEADEATERNLPIVGEGALMAQLSRARDRSMHSIVATIQAEQDQAIRAPEKGVVLITGGPGTGKTVVALHRAAFLLYGDRRRYETGGVLVVGPSGVFMRYIERVLPSLGETAVALRSLGEVVDGLRASRRDDPRVAEVKGSVAMAELLRRASRQSVPGAPREFRVFYRDDVLLLGPRELGQVRRQLLSMGPRNRSTTKVASTLIDTLWRQVKSERARERTKEDFAEEMRTSDAFLDFAASWWPVLDAATVLGWLGDYDLLTWVAEGVLDDEAVRLLSKSWSEDLSVDDIPLIDELRYLLGDPPLVNDTDQDELGLADTSLQELSLSTEREWGGQRTWTPPTNRVEDDGYAHVLIDEAQDLTPMQWRMVGRRGRTATWTIVGDPAQSSWPVPAEAARARAEALGKKDLHEFHLSTNYRNSSEIYAFAAEYAQRAGLQADLPNAVRSTGIDPRHLVDPDLEGATRRTLADLVDAVAGTVGIVVPVARRAEVSGWVAGWPETDGMTEGDDARVVVLTGLDTKGLEFDAIIVVEPQEIETESPTGTATLYVVYTRATQQMVTVASSSPGE